MITNIPRWVFYNHRYTAKHSKPRLWKGSVKDVALWSSSLPALIRYPFVFIYDSPVCFSLTCQIDCCCSHACPLQQPSEKRNWTFFDSPTATLICSHCFQTAGLSKLLWVKKFPCLTVNYPACSIWAGGDQQEPEELEAFLLYKTPAGLHQQSTNPCNDLTASSCLFILSALCHSNGCIPL